MAAALSSARPLRIVTMYPNYDWSRIWRNLHIAWIPDTVRFIWYMVLHDILPKKELLNMIAISDSDHCNYCGQTDTLSHRVIECGAGGDMWRWAGVRMAAILRINACYVSDDWPFRPQFNIWPRQRHGACLMDSGLLCILPCTAPRPAQLAGLCGFHAASVVEGALPTSAPKEGRELSDSVVGVLSIVPPRASHPSSGRRISGCSDDTESIRSHKMDLM
jgi:hypothetical protein